MREGGRTRKLVEERHRELLVRVHPARRGDWAAATAASVAAAAHLQQLFHGAADVVAAHAEHTGNYFLIVVGEHLGELADAGVGVRSRHRGGISLRRHGKVRWRQSGRGLARVALRHRRHLGRDRQRGKRGRLVRHRVRHGEGGRAQSRRRVLSAGMSSEEWLADG